MIDLAKGKSIIQNIDDIANKVVPILTGLFITLNLAGVLPTFMGLITPIVFVAIEIAVAVWNILFPAYKIVKANEAAAAEVKTA